MHCFLKVNFILIFLTISLYPCAQKGFINNQGNKFNIVNINNLGFYYNYYSYEKQLNLLYDTYHIENKNKLTREIYENLNLNLISSSKKIGEIYYRDTINYNSNINIEDVHNIVRGTLYQNYLREFDYNKTGIYYFDVLCDINWYQAVYLKYKIILNENNAILECRQNQTFSISEGENPEFEETGMDYYNSKTIGIYKASFKTNSGNFENYDRFRRNKAFNQIYFISILNDVKSSLKKYFTDYFYEISEQKRQLELK
jgi:hypothetical protein